MTLPWIIILLLQSEQIGSFAIIFVQKSYFSGIISALTPPVTAAIDHVQVHPPRRSLLRSQPADQISGGESNVSTTV